MGASPTNHTCMFSNSKAPILSRLVCNLSGISRRPLGELSSIKMDTSRFNINSYGINLKTTGVFECVGTDIVNALKYKLYY